MRIEDKDLEAAIDFPRLAQEMVEIVKKCHHPLGQFARLEKERQRQQERANREACLVDDLQERIKLLEAVAEAARAIFESRDLHWDAPAVERTSREAALKAALDHLKGTKP